MPFRRLEELAEGAATRLEKINTRFETQSEAIEAAGQTLVLRGDGEKVALISQSHWNFASYEKEAAA